MDSPNDILARVRGALTDHDEGQGLGSLVDVLTTPTKDTDLDKVLWDYLQGRLGQQKAGELNRLVLAHLILPLALTQHEYWLEHGRASTKILSELLTKDLQAYPPTLSNVDLRWANLSGANLSWANLSQTDLTGAKFNEANLYKANLSGASLSQTDLTGADLTGAILTGAILTGAILTEAKFNEAQIDYNTLISGDLSSAQMQQVLILHTLAPL